MSAKPLRVAVVGAGMGGLACAAALASTGHDVTVFEQAPAFKRIGAGIQVTPNAVKALRGLGLEDQLCAVGFRAEFGLNREARSGDVTNRIELGERIVARCGAPLITMHRGDLHSLLLSGVPPEAVRLDRRLAHYRQSDDGVELLFEDGSSAAADLLIAADGVHSIVRRMMFGAEPPKFVGRVAYRATFPATLLGGLAIDPRCKWWGEDRHIVIYFTTAARDEIYFVTSTPEPDFARESWSAKGDLGELRRAYADFHPTVRAVLEACPEAHKWALVDREPLARWIDGRVALLGDACHPMTPYMAQGAASAIEDAIVLARSLESVSATAIPEALRRYESTRRPRASEIQRTSAANTWMRERTDFDWVYGYDPWSAPLG